MRHVLSPRSLPCSLLLIAALGCPAGPEGDDLPPGAFTTGGDYVTSVDPSETTTPGSSDDVPPGTVSFAEDIQPIFNTYCLEGVCHDNEGPPEAALDLQSDGARDRLCTSNSSSQTSIELVDCDGLDPEESWLWSKVTGDGLEIPGAGSLMPVGGMLTSDELDTLEAWITGGALP